MDYMKLMVHLDLGVSNQALLATAGDLATRFGAAVIGIAACQPIAPIYGDVPVSGELLEADLEEIAREDRIAETSFRAALGGHRLEWRRAVTGGSLADYVADQARAADLIITAPHRRIDPSRRVPVGDLVMRAGRPLLIVPQWAAALALGHALVAWKDSPEARRAVHDALPFLKHARQVTVVAIASGAELETAREAIGDVARWLSAHGIAADTLAMPSRGSDASRLDAIATELGADLLVAGAYGHNRAREWLFGGVTQDLLLDPCRHTLLSH